MPHTAIADSAISHSVYVSGGIMGAIGGLSFLSIASGVLIVARFIYDSVRFYNYVIDRRKNKTKEK